MEQLPFWDRHLGEILVVAILGGKLIALAIFFGFRSIGKKIDDLDTEFVSFRKIVYQKFDKGFEEHKEFEGRMGYIEGKTNGRHERRQDKP